MNRLQKAAAFGAMMGKRAAEVTPPAIPAVPGYPALSGRVFPDYPALPGRMYPNMIPKGGPHNPAGALQGANTYAQLPYASKNDGSYDNMKTWNYSNSDIGLGPARRDFHTNLTNALNKDNKFDAWDKRMGVIADEQSEKAPIKHVVWPGQGFGPPRRRVDVSSVGGTAMPERRGTGIEAPHSSTLSLPNSISPSLPGTRPGVLDTNLRPKDKPNALGNLPVREIPYAYSPYAEDNKEGYPSSFASHGNSAVHEGTHAGDQSKWPYFELGEKVMPGYTNEKGKPIAGTKALGNTTLNGDRPAIETAASWNEIAQGSRAFKDVTGKDLPGAYTFAPGMDMDYRELAALAKKYRVGDLNTPTGQKFLQQVLRNSKTNAPTTPPVDLSHPSIRDFSQENKNEAATKVNDTRTAAQALPKDAPYEVWGPAHGAKMEAEKNYVRASNPAPQHPGPKFNSKGYITYPNVPSYGKAPGPYEFISPPIYPSGYPYGPEKLPPGYGN